jgi:hypothetical protein
METSNWMGGSSYSGNGAEVSGSTAGSLVHVGAAIPDVATVTTSATILGVSGQGNGTQQTGPPHHLLSVTDCILVNGVRSIDYALKDANNNQLTGYSVTEHLVDRSNGQPDTSGLSGPDGTTTSPPDKNTGDSGFGDYIGGLGFHDDLQTFTATSMSSGQAFNVFVRDIHDNDFGTNGIYISGGAVYVNGDISEPPCH